MTIEELDLAVWSTFYRMQKVGLRVDPERAGALQESVTHKRNMARVLAESMVGEEFNPMSGDQVAAILAKRGHHGKKTPKGSRMSTNEKTLKQIKDPLVDLILEYRGLDKLLNTFLAAIQGKERIHPRWKLTRVRSGRVACEEPNLMAFPSRDEIGLEIRKCFVPDPGHVMFSVDYSQIEPRLVAILSRDPKLMAVYQDRRDIYVDVMENLKLSSRLLAKTLTLGIFYGLGGKGLSERLNGDGLGLDERECDALIARWFATYRGVAQYVNNVCAGARQRDGWAVTQGGRMRRLPGLFLEGKYWPENYLRAEAERQCFNHMIQGTAQEFMKHGMIEVKEAPFTPLLQIHDEIVGQIAEEDEDIVPDIAEMMIYRNVYESGIDLTTEFETGASWGALKG